MARQYGLTEMQVDPKLLANLVDPAARVYGHLHEDYRNYRHFSSSMVEEFLQQFIDDESTFGFRRENTYVIGLRLCDYCGSSTGNEDMVNWFADVLEDLFVTVADDAGWSERSRVYYDQFEQMIQGILDLTWEGYYPKESEAEEDEEETTDMPTPPRNKEHLLRDALAAKGTQDSKQVLDQAVAELHSLIGLPSVKAEVKRLTGFLDIQRQRRQHGLRGDGQTLHFVFRGNPGTGKTTVARIIGKLLYGFGILKTTKFIECSRSDLVAGYLGQTAIKTDERIREALDGVLFIDEAYALSQKGDDSYGREAIDTLVKRMEDYRDRLTVIVAGYPCLMDEFIASNPGLRSRFTRFLDFEDYSVGELIEIFDKFCNDAQYAPDAGCRRGITTLFTLVHAERDETFGNARDVRNVYQEATTRLALRLHETPGKTIAKDDLMRLVAADIPLLDKLIEIGKRRGYLTISQINQYLSDDCTEEEVRSLVETFARNGIEIIADEEAEERKKASSFLPSSPSPRTCGPC